MLNNIKFLVSKSDNRLEKTIYIDSRRFKSIILLVEIYKAN